MRILTLLTRVCAVALLTVGAVQVQAQTETRTEVSVYLGNQTAPASQVTTSGDRVIPDRSFRQRWMGQSFEAPIYIGARYTKWRSEHFGYGLDYVHNKVKPAPGAQPAGFRRLELTDGLNIWTLNAYYMWPEAFGPVSPYVGAGLGISAPGVEVRYGTSDTFEYQVTGPAAAWLAGLRYDLNETWSVFAEYKGTYSSNKVSLATGGTLSSDIFTDAVNLGFTRKF